MTSCCLRDCGGVLFLNEPCPIYPCSCCHLWFQAGSDPNLSGFLYSQLHSSCWRSSLRNVVFIPSAAFTLETGGQGPTSCRAMVPSQTVSWSLSPCVCGTSLIVIWVLWRSWSHIQGSCQGATYGAQYYGKMLCVVELAGHLEHLPCGPLFQHSWFTPLLF